MLNLISAMEPMITGSPSSPNRQERFAGENVAQNFLPAYLLGTPESKSASQPASCTALHKHHRVTWSPELNHTAYYDVNNSGSFYNFETPDDQKRAFILRGPPTTSLSVSEGENAFTDVPWNKNSSNGVPTSGESTSNQQSANYHYDLNSTSDSVAAVDNTCVTVFGFAPDMLQFVIQQFAQCGSIINYEVPNKCNWIHVMFQSKLQAKKALEKNGRLLSDCVRIGVIPCTDRSALARLSRSVEKRPALSELAHNSDTPVRPVSVPVCGAKPWSVNNFCTSPSAHGTATTPVSSKANMRPLTFSSTATNVTDYGATDAGLLSRARHFVLGW